MFAQTLTEELQAELHALSSNSLYIIVDGATHDSLVAEREHAPVVVDAIRPILETARTGNALVEPMEMPRTSLDRSRAAAGPADSIAAYLGRANSAQERQRREMSVYEIRVKGHLDPRWSEWFDGLQITNEPNGAALLSGCIPDQAALHGMLARVRDLNLQLISVTSVDSDQQEGSGDRGAER
jgi:hypothetical protein